jgi:hypothetical protein
MSSPSSVVPRALGGKCRCRRVVLFTALSLGTIGSLILLLLTMMILVIKLSLTKIAQTIFILTIAFLVFFIGLLVFAIYASCKVSQILRIIVTVIFIVLGLGLFALSLYCLIANGSIFEALGSLWDDPILDDSLDFVDVLEKGFHCCGWNETRPSCRNSFEDLCNETFKRVFSKDFAAVSASLLVLSMALLTGSVFAVKTLFVPELPNDREQSLGGSLIGSARGNARSKHYNASSW